MIDALRLTTLEERYAHLEKLVTELNEVIYRQQRDLDTLQQQVAQLRDKMGGDPGIVDPSQHERPPHY
ncbi:MAG: SlyX family protein [Myxococcaceae bacterium]|nr:SlyX family protein [Myxococcaceae bacterium]